MLCLCDRLLKKYYARDFQYQIKLALVTASMLPIVLTVLYMIVQVWGRGAGKFQFLEKYTTYFKRERERETDRQTDRQRDTERE